MAGVRYPLITDCFVPSYLVTFLYALPDTGFGYYEHQTLPIFSWLKYVACCYPTMPLNSVSVSFSLLTSNLNLVNYCSTGTEILFFFRMTCLRKFSSLLVIGCNNSLSTPVISKTSSFIVLSTYEILNIILFAEPITVGDSPAVYAMPCKHFFFLETARNTSHLSSLFKLLQSKSLLTQEFIANRRNTTVSGRHNFKPMLHSPFFGHIRSLRVLSPNCSLSKSASCLSSRLSYLHRRW